MEGAEARVLPELWTVYETAEVLRAKPGTVRGWAKDGVLPSIKMNKRVLFKKEDVLAFLDERLRPRHELSDEAIRNAVKVLRKAELPNDDPDAEPGSPSVLTRTREVRDDPHGSAKLPELRN